MKGFIGTALLSALALAGPASAQTAESGPVVVELFTSQGCSSCPPADALFSELAGRGDVIALALHVDYWDYLGWRDEFADPKFTKRQKSYARAAGARTVYTPQMVVGGMEHLVGVRAMELSDLIAAHAGKGRVAHLTISRQGEAIAISAEALQPLPEGAVVQLVRYRPSETVVIKRGENAGRTVTYHNIVESWQTVGEWSGTDALSMTADAPGSDPAVVILQEPGPGPILAAAALR